MGVDGRGVKKGEVPRSDTMLVASLDPVKKKFYVFSILRDTYVDIPDHGTQRINAAITYGPNTAMQTVSDLLGIPIQYYVYTDFQGFIKLVDAVGGVDYEVEKDMRYTTKADGPEYDIDLKKASSTWMAKWRCSMYASAMMPPPTSPGPSASAASLRRWRTR